MTFDIWDETKQWTTEQQIKREEWKGKGRTVDDKWRFHMYFRLHIRSSFWFLLLSFISTFCFDVFQFIFGWFGHKTVFVVVCFCALAMKIKPVYCLKPNLFIFVICECCHQQISVDIFWCACGHEFFFFIICSFQWIFLDIFMEFSRLFETICIWCWHFCRSVTLDWPNEKLRFDILSVSFCRWLCRWANRQKSKFTVVPFIICLLFVFFWDFFFTSFSVAISLIAVSALQNSRFYFFSPRVEKNSSRRFRSTECCVCVCLSCTQDAVDVVWPMNKIAFIPFNLPAYKWR